MEVGFHKYFRKQFNKLPRRMQKFFYSKLDIFMLDPFNPLLNNHKLSGKLKNMRSINVTGDIRAIYEQAGKDRVLFLMIASHGKLYD